MALARLDHVIFHVPAIHEAHARLARAFPEAWPIGRFWPMGRTSGLALGGINLELVQRDDPVEQPIGTTLVFEPSSLEAAQQRMRVAGIRSYFEEKVERDPTLLRLRGFPGAASRVPQTICTNLYPVDPGPMEPYPFDFFACDYSPFLKAWLSSENPRLRTESRALRVLYGTPEPVRAQNLLLELGYMGAIEIEFTRADARSILRIETTAGPVSI